MKQLHKLALLAILSCGVLASCSADDESEDNCANYTGPALTKGPKGTCYYVDTYGNTVLNTSEACNCAK